MNVQVGQPRHHTLWEALALLLNMIIWKICFEWDAVFVLDDHVPALHNPLDLSGKGPHLAMPREIA